MLDWRPKIVPGAYEHSWTKGPYEIRPVKDPKFPLGGRYEVLRDGQVLAGDPTCLLKARGRAEMDERRENAKLQTM